MSAPDSDAMTVCVKVDIITTVADVKKLIQALGEGEQELHLDKVSVIGIEHPQRVVPSPHLQIGNQT